jgi:hypothetical protein
MLAAEQSRRVDETARNQCASYLGGLPDDTGSNKGRGRRAVACWLLLGPRHAPAIVRA